tara:strand:- start:4748 stop:5143 length:396 start_codon:yes stop_codon:yes gene_type:complete
MAKFIHNAALDALLDNVIALNGSNGLKLYVATSAFVPGTTALSDASVLSSVGVNVTLSAKADGATDGRKITITPNTVVAITSAGSVEHIILVNSNSSDAHVIVTATSSPVTVANLDSLTVPAFDYTTRDAA